MVGEKRLIDTNALITYFEEQCDIAAKDTAKESTYVLAALKCCIDLFQRFPTVDAVEVVRCKDCKNKREYTPTRWFCGLSGMPIDGDDFCSHGEQPCNFCGAKKDGG